MDNFIVSARKYRPATFVSVVGQNHITSTLKNAISRSQLAHAYLFCGPRGVGKTTCARIFAKAINCTSPVDNEACGECESCRSFNEGRSFNIHELDAASNNSVDDIRSLTDQVRIPPQIGRYSVYIIDEVHMLSAQAFNAFLKTLEEPPAHAIFILATTEKHKIIPTILSRCQIYDFNRIRVEDGVEYLKYIAGQEEIAFDDESLHLIAQKADGGMRDALSMFDKAVSFCGRSLNFREVAQTLNVLDYDTYFNITSLILGGDYPATLTLFDEVLRKGFSGQTFIGGLNAHFRDMLMCKNPQTIGLLEVTGTLLERYKKQGGECDAGFLFEAIALLTALDGTLRTATNQRLNIELGLMKLCGLGQKKNNGVASGGSGTDAAPSASAASDASPSAEIADRLATAGKAELPPLVKHGGQPSGSPTPTQASATPPAQTPPQGDAPQTSIPQAQASAPVQAPAGEASGPADAPAAQPATVDAVNGHEQASAQSAATGGTGNDEQATTKAAASQSSPQSAATPNPSADRPHSSAPVQSGNLPGDAPKPMTRAAIHGMPQTISGNSISAILNNSKNPYETAEDDSDAAQNDSGRASGIDPQAQSKILEHKDKFIRNLNSERPRIAMAFHGMTVEGNKISLTVPSEALYEEIMRNRTEILTLLTEIAGIEGLVELAVIIKEDTGARRPIKVEDKLRFLTEKNPNVALLRQRLDMDIE